MRFTGGVAVFFVMEGLYRYNEAMPSQYTKWSEDKRLVDYLDHLRKANMAQWAVCHFCDQKSIGIKAIKEKLYSVCEDHGDDDVS